jgi:hypothetical protein
MPWDEKQRQAIYLSVKRKKGEKAAKALMHKHGYGGKKKKRKKRGRSAEAMGRHARSKKGRR